DRLIRDFVRKEEEAKEDAPGGEDEPEKTIDAKAGLNRFVWDLRMFPPTLLPKAVIWGGKEGPMVAPGAYRVKLTVGDRSFEEKLDVVGNPAVHANPEDLKRQYAFLEDVRNSLSETHASVVRIRSVKQQVKDVLAHAKDAGKEDALKEPAKALTDKLSAIEEKLVNPKVKANQDVLNFPPKLDHQFVGLTSVVSTADAAPAPSAYALNDELKKQLAGIRAELNAVLDKDLAEFNRAVQDAGVPPIVVPKAKDPAAPAEKRP
ncbi:MAG TPA: glycosyl hydrolase, partial [Thermoanaerobaculia bacterium]|nr:glycosyl hydrolase [Thermoanaerobaculia bacterium]